jgi:hypothetical protein
LGIVKKIGDDQRDDDDDDKSKHERKFNLKWIKVLVIIIVVAPYTSSN